MDTTIAREIYFNPSHPGSFGGVNRLYKNLKQYGYSREQAKDFLMRQPVYTLHRSRKFHFKRNPIITYSKDYQWQCDLADMKKYSGANYGYKYLLVVIDCFTKYLWVRALKSKQPGDVKRAFENILEDGRKPIHLMSDRGGEFANGMMYEFYKRNGINYFTSWTSVKCSIVERVNRTLKSRMFRYFTYAKTNSYVHILSAFVESYNNSYHRSIKMTPNEAITAPSSKVFQNLYSEQDLSSGRMVKKNAIAVSDTVRVAYDKTPFSKGYETTFSEAKGRVTNVNNSSKIPLYSLVDESDKHLKRKFYGQELQAIPQQENE